MEQKQQIRINHTASKLERFVIGFEYDKTLQQLKNEVRIRTLD
jgi:hypothetical protein